MFFIRLWLACAIPKKEVSSVHSLIPTNLETIDLRLEFGDEYQGWYYMLNQIEVEEGMNVTIQPETGWAAFGQDEDHLLGTGFAPESTPSEVCATGCRLVLAQVSQSEQVTAIPLQSDQDLSDSAPVKSAGLSMIETWRRPLKSLPVQNKHLRLRAVTLEPNGNVGQHKHHERPSFAYIVSGHVTEHREDGDGVHLTGNRVAERHGLVHWWENGDAEATILVFDIIDAD